MTQSNKLGFGRGDVNLLEDPTGSFYSNVSMVTLAQPAGWSVLIGDAGQMLSNILPLTAKGVLLDVRLATIPGHGAEVQFRQHGESANPWDVRGVKAMVLDDTDASYLSDEVQEQVAVECDGFQQVDFRVQPMPGYAGDNSVVSLLEIQPIGWFT